MSKRNSNKKTPYDQPASRSTRSSSKKNATSDRNSEPVSQDIVDSQPSSSNDEVQQSQGPSWKDFNILKESVKEMHSLLKSLNVNSSLASSNTDKVNEVDNDDGFTVDNHIQVSVDKPREAPNVPMVVSFGDKGDSNLNIGNSGVNDQATKSHDNIQTSVNRFLDSIANTASTSGERIYREPGRPIDLKVTDKQKQKIWGDQYIDLATLLDPHQSSQIELTIVSNPGEPIHFGPSKKPKTINNLGQWCSAFEIFISVYCQKTPTAICPLLTYMKDVKLLAHKDGDYLTYDREFRMMRETLNIPWELVHNGLWLECRDTGARNKNKNTSHNMNDSFRGKGSNYKQSQNKHPVGYCFRYHSFGKCGRASCLFKHECYECKDEKHPIFKCPKTAKKGGNETNTKQ